MNFIRNRNFRAGPQTSLEGFICPQNSDKQQKIKVFGRSVGGQVFIDDDVELCVNKTMPGVTPKLLIGNRVHFGKMNRIGCDNKIVIEDDVLFAPHVHISDRNHGFEDINTPISRQKVVSKGAVVIGAETWLGFGCQVMSGVKIGRHCVIAAGAVVVKDVPDYSVVGGNPARILKKFNQITNKWEKYDD